MKRTIYILSLLAIALCSQAKLPKFLTKARLAPVSILTHDAEGNLREGQGVILNAQGEIITEYDLLKGAVKATVVDANGTEYPVKYICGASSMYNIVKLCIEPGKEKLSFLETAQAEMPAGAIAYVLPNVKADKKAIASEDTIKSESKFRESYHYYSLAGKVSERQVSSAVLNSEGQLIGLAQLPTKKEDEAYVIDARFGGDLQITVLNASSADLRSIPLPKRLPEGEEAASSFILLSGTKDTAQYLSYVADFIRLYPNSATGYIMKAEALAAAGQYAESEKAYADGFAQEGTKKDELHYSLSKTIYDLTLRPSYQPYADWNIDRSVAEAAKAYEVNPLDIYRNQQAHALYVAKKYDEACKIYLDLTQTNMRTADLFLYAALCKQKQDAPIDEIISLQDSAVNCFTKPYPAAAASAILMRGTSLALAGKNREAVMDYNEYEHLMAGNLPANFYYEREQLEVKCRMYPAALNDIERAIRLKPNEPLYYAECASLNYRVGQVDEAIVHAQQAIKVAPAFADAHRILGVCFNQKGDKQKAREHLKKAVELGDQMAQSVLDKL